MTSSLDTRIRPANPSFSAMIPAMMKDRHETGDATDSGYGVVLVIDESVPVRTKLVEILQKLGTSGGEIIEAESAEEGLAAFRGKRPSIVFTELVGVHPEDGLDAIHEMLGFDPLARIVLVTAEPRESAEVRAAVRAGVFAIIEKPVRYEKIRAVLADLEAEDGGIQRMR